MLDVHAARNLLQSAWRIQWHEQVGSTNDIALEAARAGEPECLVVGAETQTRGRGRFGRRWLDVPRRCLLFSMLLRPPEGCPREPLGLAAAVAVADAARRFGANLGLRWPNDLYWRGRKVCGILTEAAGGAVVVGVGINVAGAGRLPAELNAATISQAAGRPVPREALLAAVLDQFARRYSQLRDGATREVIDAARRLDDLVGRSVLVQCGHQRLCGRCAGIDDHGCLLLETKAGRLALSAGEVIDVRDEQGTHG